MKSVTSITLTQEAVPPLPRKLKTGESQTLPFCLSLRVSNLLDYSLFRASRMCHLWLRGKFAASYSDSRSLTSRAQHAMYKPQLDWASGLVQWSLSLCNYQKVCGNH